MQATTEQTQLIGAPEAARRLGYTRQHVIYKAKRGELEVRSWLQLGATRKSPLFASDYIEAKAAELKAAQAETVAA